MDRKQLIASIAGVALVGASAFGAVAVGQGAGEVTVSQAPALESLADSNGLEAEPASLMVEAPAPEYDELDSAEHEYEELDEEEGVDDEEHGEQEDEAEEDEYEEDESEEDESEEDDDDD